MSRFGRPLRILLIFISVPLLFAQAPAELSAALSAGNFQEAIRLADAILNQHPSDARTWTLRGVALIRLRQTPAGLVSFQRALDIAPTYLPALQGAAQTAYEQHDPSASSFLHRIIKDDPENVTAHAMLGALAAESKDCRTALAEFGQAKPLIQKNSNALLQYGDCQLAERHATDALTTFRQLVELEPGSTSARFKLAVSLQAAGQTLEAIDLLKSLPEDDKTLNLLAESYAKQNDWKSAISALRRAIHIRPGEEQNYVDLSVIYIEQKLPQAALETANEALRHVPDSARLYTLRGAAYTWLNDPQRASKDFEAADRLEPEQLYGSVGLSMLLRMNNSLPEAIKILRGKLAERPSDPTLNYLLADTLVRTGVEPGQPSFREAVNLLKKAVSLDSNFQKAHVSLGKLYLIASNPEGALLEFRVATNLDRKDRSALMQLVVLLHRTGKLEEAEAMAARLRSLIVADNTASSPL